VFYTLAYIYEEEDTCHMRRRIHVYEHGSFVFYTLAYIYEEEDTCHMRRRIHAYEHGSFVLPHCPIHSRIYMRRRIHAI